MRVLIVFLFIFTAALKAQASECDLELLQEGGRAYLELIDSGLESGVLEPDEVADILTHQFKFNPVVGTHSKENLALYDAFEIALKEMLPGEWPIVKGGVAGIVKRLQEKKSKVDQAREDTAAIFKLRATQYGLGVGGKIEHTFVSSKGVVYFHTIEGGVHYLRELHSDRRVSITIYGVRGFSFMETSAGEVVMTFADKLNNVKVLRARDLGVLLQKNFTERFIVRVHGLNPVPFELNGKLKVAVYPLAMGNIERRPIIIMDVETGAETGFELRESAFVLRLGPNGRLYAAGVGRDSVTKGGFAFIEDLTDLENRDLIFSREYSKYLGTNFSNLSPILTFDGGGLSSLYLIENSTFSSLWRTNIPEHTLQQVSTLMGMGFASYQTASGEYHHAYISNGKAKALFFGPMNRLSKVDYPAGLNVAAEHLSVVNTPLGQMALFWTKERGHPKAAYLTDSSGVWIKLQVPERFEIVHLQRTFYDPVKMRTLIWMKTRPDDWKLFQLFGR